MRDSIGAIEVSLALPRVVADHQGELLRLIILARHLAPFRFSSIAISKSVVSCSLIWVSASIVIGYAVHEILAYRKVGLLWRVLQVPAERADKWVAGVNSDGYFLAVPNTSVAMYFLRRTPIQHLADGLQLLARGLGRLRRGLGWLGAFDSTV